MRPILLLAALLALGGCAVAGQTMSADARTDEPLVFGRIEMVDAAGRPLAVAPTAFIGHMHLVVVSEATGREYSLRCDRAGLISPFAGSLPPGRYRITKVVSGALRHVTTQAQGQFTVEQRQLVYIGTLRFVGKGLMPAATGVWTLLDELDATLTALQAIRPGVSSDVAVSLVTGVPATQPPLRGSVSDGTYTSPRRLFSFRVPKASNWAGVQFEIQEAMETGPRNYDMVAFYVKDFGEVRIASVRRIPRVALDNMAKDNPTSVLRNIADKALGDWRQNFPQDPEVIDEQLIPTTYGQGIQRVYKAARGSLMEKLEGGSGKGFERFDVLIGVILVIRNDHYISAIAEDDHRPLDTVALMQSLKTFFTSIRVADAPHFESR
ncbi:MAG: hypothetical protein HYU41_03805 [Candidatus Rokubacteria bacterium]|nr:hypothetical protein [Candidatus Rokubacteria bacterium]